MSNFFLNSNRLFSQRHGFHLVDPSPWPLASSFSSIRKFSSQSFVMFIEAKVRGRLSELRALALASKVGYSEPVLAVLNNDVLFFKIQEHYVSAVLGSKTKFNLLSLDKGLKDYIVNHWKYFLDIDNDFTGSASVRFGGGYEAGFVNKIKRRFKPLLVSSLNFPK